MNLGGHGSGHCSGFHRVKAVIQSCKVSFGGLVAKSCLTLLTRRAAARQAPLSMGFSRQEYHSGLPFPSPGDLPNSGIEPGSSALQADYLPIDFPKCPLGLAKQRSWLTSVLLAEARWPWVMKVLSGNK